MAEIVFFEAQKGDRHYYNRHLKEHRLLFREDPLDTAATRGLEQAEVLSVFIHSPASAGNLSRFPNLRLITTRSTGYNHIDLDYCHSRGITVCNVPVYGENTVAEHTFALLLSLSRNLHRAYLRTIRENFSLTGLQGFDLVGKTLGVVGAGRIGLHVIKIARGFNMEVLAADPNPDPFLAEVLQFRYLPLDQVLSRSDIISLHAPLNNHTRHLINRQNIHKIKKGAVLINTARGELVETEALLEALNTGILSGAGLDVLEGEGLLAEEEKLFRPGLPRETLSTLLKNHLLLHREDVVITPHIGFYSREAVARIRQVTAANILFFLEGHIQNQVKDP
jgi:D-lactate dehydrogenase